MLPAGGVRERVLRRIEQDWGVDDPAGLLAWLAQSKQLAADALNDLAPADLEAALRHAMAAAAINVQRQGCQPPTWDETRAALCHAAGSLALVSVGAQE